jgi:hypothetical protein
MAHDLRALLRWTVGRADQPTAVILDGRTLQSTRRAGRVPTTMGTNAARVARHTSPSTR